MRSSSSSLISTSTVSSVVALDTARWRNSHQFDSEGSSPAFSVDTHPAALHHHLQRRFQHLLHLLTPRVPPNRHDRHNQ